MKLLFHIETPKKSWEETYERDIDEFDGEINVFIEANAKDISILGNSDGDMLFTGNNWYIGIRDYDRYMRYDEEGNYNPFVVKIIDEIALGAEELNQKNTIEITDMFNAIRNEHYVLYDICDWINEEYEILCSLKLK